jgi:hypothetical protein
MIGAIGITTSTSVTTKMVHWMMLDRRRPADRLLAEAKAAVPLAGALSSK